MALASGHGRNSVLKLDNRSGSITDISAYCTKWEFSPSSESQEATSIGDKGVVRVAGIGDSNLDFEGNWGTTIADILDDALSKAKSFECHPHGTASGAVKYTGETIMSSVNIDISFDAIVTYSASCEGDGAYTRGSN